MTRVTRWHARDNVWKRRGRQPLPPYDDPGWLEGWGLPVWRDEFDYIDPVTDMPAMDPTKWNIRDRTDLGLTICSGWTSNAPLPGNHPDAPPTVFVDEQQRCHIQANWIPSVIASGVPLSRTPSATGVDVLTAYTGYIDHRNLNPGNVHFSQQYGRWEMRGHTPSGAHKLGAHQGFWLRPDSSPGEIDIMEAWGYNEVAAPGGQRINTGTTTIHTLTAGFGENYRKKIWHHRDYGWNGMVGEGFHTWAFEYTPTYYAMIVDGQELYRETPATYPDLWNPQFFGSPLHLRINQHVGSSNTYWGVPDPSLGPDQTRSVFPFDFIIEHVRIWALPS